MKIRPLRAQLFHAEGQMDVQRDMTHDEANSRLSQFYERASRTDRRLLSSGKLLVIYLRRLFHDVICMKYNS
jgi:hypothetical protein